MNTIHFSTAATAAFIAPPTRPHARTALAGTTALLALLMLATSAAAQLVINELYFHAPQAGGPLAPTAPEDIAQEWLELHNVGPTAIDLSGWKLARGVTFVFPPATQIAGGGYLVVCANPSDFGAAHPGAGPVAGPWLGDLSNIDDTVELQDPAGTVVEAVHYDTEGDWAHRRHVATLDPNGYPYGWLWLSSADGGGKSLEVLNPARPRTEGQNWAPSGPDGGTPGAANSAHTADAAPFILKPKHRPKSPSSTQLVTVSAEVTDELTTALVAELKWRVSSLTPPAFSSLSMHDDGLNGDETAGDSVFSANIPAQANHAVVEYFVEARDAASQTRTWPAPTDDARTQHLANALYQVDNESYAGSAPLYRIVMTAAELDALDREPYSGTNRTAQQYLCTFVTSAQGDIEVRQQCSIRIRGNGSRGSHPRSVRVNFLNDEPWQDNVAININGRFTYMQFLGALLAQSAGITASDTKPVAVRFNGQDRAAQDYVDPLNEADSRWTAHYGLYASVEPINRDFLRHHFPHEPGGNLYAKRGRAGDEWVPATGAPASHPTHYIDEGWEKQNNTSQLDFSDLHHFASVMTDNAAAPGPDYLTNVSSVLDLPQWLKALAVETVFTDGETKIFNGRDDDYSFYRAPDGKMRVLTHDFDTILGLGDSSSIPFSFLPYTLFDIVIAGKGGDTFNKLIPLFDQPAVVQAYYHNLRALLTGDGPFSKKRFDELVTRELAHGGWKAAEIDAIRNQVIAFADARRENILTTITPALTATSGLAVSSGYERTTSTTAGPITGTFDVAGAAQILINGQAATLDRRAGIFSSPTVTLRPGLNRITIEENDASGTRLRRTFLDVWRDVAAVAKSGALAASATWTAASGPYQLTGEMTIGNGVTLTIQAGTTIYMGPAASITVSGTGNLLANGTVFAPIRFTRRPGTTDAYGSIAFTNASTESRLVWCDLEFGAGRAIGGHTATLHDNGSKLLVDHCTFTNSDAQYFSSDAGSFIISNSYFQTYSKPAGYPPANGTSGFGRPEMLHGSNGLPAGGYGIFKGNLFGHTFGFNDIIDFTGGNRPGPILQVIDNIFSSATDDCLDLDSTDAFISGNIFLNVHQDPARSDTADTGSAISGGTDNADVSEWTIYGNLFYHVDHAVLAKGVNGQSNTKADRFTFLNNTIHTVTGSSSYGSVGVDIAAFNFSDDDAGIPPASGGAGAIIAHNIISDCPAVVANYDGAKLWVTMNDNILPAAWSGPGVGNVVSSAPGLRPELFAALDFEAVERADDYEVLWRQAREAFALCPGSPGAGTGPGGADKGGLIFTGAQLAGVPAGTTSQTSATISVGPTGLFNPPGAIIPAFSYGFISYQWKLDAGAFSADVPAGTPISLSSLAAGTHTLQVRGRNDAGDLQAVPTTAVWTVDPQFSPPVRLNEVLAANTSAFAHGIGFPDALELYNPGTTATDLSDWGITDDPLQPRKFVFPPGTVLPAGAHLVLIAAVPDGTAGLFLGFALDGDGDNLVLTASPALGGGVVDSLAFGLQLPDHSIGRTGPAATWDLTVPTLGTVNLHQPTDCPGRVLINEWIAGSQISFREDQVELYNPSSLPAAIGGHRLTDTPDVPPSFQFRPLSFVAAHGFAVLEADGSATPSSQSNRLPFKLNAHYDWLVLSAADGTILDRVPVTCAQTDVSEGRLPDGASDVQILDFPSPGLPNANGIPPASTTVVTNVVPTGATWNYRDDLNDPPASDGSGHPWTAPNYNESGWKSGASPLGRDPDLATIVNPSTGTAPFFATDFSSPPSTYSSPRISYYFRTTFPFGGSPADATLRLSRWIDDGYLLYLNGQVIDRKNLAGPPPLAWDVRASPSIDDASAETGLQLTLPAGALVTGTNQLAVEVHQSSQTSSDIVFAINLDAAVSTTVPGVPDPQRERMKDLTDFLRITEVMFDPANGTNYEFVELRNVSTSRTLDLTGVRFTEGIQFTLPSMSLAPGGYVIVARDKARFTSVYGGAPVVAGDYGGRLENSGESITLSLPLPYTSAIQRFRYEPFWFPAADGQGASLEITTPVSGAAARSLWNEKSLWQASTAIGGTPSGLNAVSNFATWMTAYGLGGAQAGDDADADGLDNLSEYALGLVPTVPDALAGMLTAELDESGHLEAAFTLPFNPPPDITYTVQAGPSLATDSWTPIAARTGSAPWSGVGTVTTGAPTGGRVLIVVIDPLTTPPTTRRFLRLKFALP